MNDMTKGSISRHLVFYAIPMILGNILQLTYNAADSVIIGKFSGETALAAVSASNPIMTVMILGASGIGIGASVIMGRFYGAKDYKRLMHEFSTTLIFSTMLSLIVFVVGFIMTPCILRYINTPPEAMTTAVGYLRIIFVGFLFSFQYNILSYAIRSIGDAKTPVIFLGLSCVLNVFLDIIFVAGFKMNAAGAGLATVIAESASVTLCIFWIRKKIPLLRLDKGDFKIDAALLAETVKSGFLTAMQQAAQPIGKVLIQSVINMQGITAIGAFNAVCRVDDFVCIPAQSIGSGIMTCTAQNVGAKNDKRIRQSLIWGIITALCYFPIICSAVLILRKPVMRLLSPSESTAMVEMGMSYLLAKSWIFVMPCVNNALQGFFRGIGHMAIVLAATVIQISIRTVCVYLWVPLIGINGEAYGCFVGWLCQFIFETLCLFILHIMRNKNLDI